MSRPPTAPPPVRVEPIGPEHMQVFVAAARRSRNLHGRWVAPPTTETTFQTYLRTRQGPASQGYLIFTPKGELAGAINLNEIVRGLFQNAFLGYYAFAPQAGRGHMSAGLSEVLRLAFKLHRLHRVEANIQPHNARSIALVKRAGFRLEGYSPRYLKIAGRWRDHERWALTREEWSTQRSSQAVALRGISKT
jgi:[ribosomal protein S5]-alanine N-acetyltransferase